MKRTLIIVSILGLIVGVTIFPEQVLGLFRGKTPLESMQMITTFVLHVVTVTIGMWALTTLPEMSGRWKKWIKSRMLSRVTRRSDVQPRSTAQKMPRMTNTQLMQLWMMQQSQRSPRREMPSQAGGQDDIHIDF